MVRPEAQCPPVGSSLPRCLMRNLDRDQTSGAPHTGLGRQPGPRVMSFQPLQPPEEHSDDPRPERGRRSPGGLQHHQPSVVPDRRSADPRPGSCIYLFRRLTLHNGDLLFPQAGMIAKRGPRPFSPKIRPGASARAFEVIGRYAAIQIPNLRITLVSKWIRHSHPEAMHIWEKCIETEKPPSALAWQRARARCAGQTPGRNSSCGRSRNYATPGSDLGIFPTPVTLHEHR